MINISTSELTMSKRFEVLNSEQGYTCHVETCGYYFPVFLVFGCITVTYAGIRPMSIERMRQLCHYLSTTLLLLGHHSIGEQTPDRSSAWRRKHTLYRSQYIACLHYVYRRARPLHGLKKNWHLLGFSFDQ